MISEHWPLANLRISTGNLELRPPSPTDIIEIADLAASGVHGPDERPFLTPWTDIPAESIGQAVLQRHWSRIGAWTPAAWRLELAVVRDGEIVGVQEVSARDFSVCREVVTGSWLGRRFHGQGIGTAMRWAALELVFGGLGATDATSLSLLDNPASMGVSRRIGYREDGVSRDPRDGEVVVSQRFRLTHKDWAAAPRPAVTVIGLDDRVRAQFGALADR